MTIIVPAVLGGLAIIVMTLVSLSASRKGKHPVASHQHQYNHSQPRILIHSINPDRCTGCDACVAVCPTNVLDLVDNKSQVLRFEDCIQCEACMWACPTTALVMHLEGTQPPPIKAPELDENFQTAVPGQYLIGEVSGKPLVKNAANLGRMVVNHMLQTGMQTLGQNSGPNRVDVAIVGSGPGGLSTALTCIRRGLSYMLLEKEQMVASTVSRYPKGKFVMAEPYDVKNYSFLPVYDSSKEQLVACWEDLIQRTRLQINKGEAVEEIKRGPDGMFQLRTTVGQYQSQRVVLATGTRGKPRTLGVPGENLPKVHSLLEDPADFKGKPVIVVGGGDSAVEAAMALADAGAKVVLSYRGASFNRCAPKNKKAVESYDAQKRVKVRYQSNIVQFIDDKVTIKMGDGSQKTYPNLAAFILIGADPPIKWLQKMGVNFIERPHAYQLGKTDELVQRFLGRDVHECSQEAGAAADMVLHGRVSANTQPAPAPQPASRKSGWLRSATQMFSAVAFGKSDTKASVPLSQFASNQRKHSGRGRRDALPAAERTRILRALRDEGASIAYDESRVDIPVAPAYGGYQSQSPAPSFDDPYAQHQGQKDYQSQQQNYQAHGYQGQQQSYQQEYQSQQGYQGQPQSRYPGHQQSGYRNQAQQANHQASAFSDEATRAMDADASLAQLLRNQPAAVDHEAEFLDADLLNDGAVDYDLGDATRAMDMDAVNSALAGVRNRSTQAAPPRVDVFDEPTRAALPGPGAFASHHHGGGGAHNDFAAAHDEATRAVDMATFQQQNAGHANPFDAEATRAVDLSNYDNYERPESLSDVEWDID